MSANQSFLAPGEILKPGQFIVSPSKKFFAIMQTDGNFCVYRGSGPLDQKNCIWATNTYGNGKCCTIMQDDGNLCLYRGAKPGGPQTSLWDSKTAGKAKNFVTIQDDGNLCIYRGTGPNDNKGFQWGSIQQISEEVTGDPLDIDDIFKKYGDWWCQIYGGKCDAMKYEVPGYKEHKLIVTPVEFEYYEDPVFKPEKPELLDNMTLRNESSVEQMQTLTVSKTTTDKVGWHVKGGIKLGAKLGFKAGVLFASMSTEFSGELNVEAGGSGEKTTSRQWTIAQPIKVPAQTETEASITVEEHSFTRKFRCTFFLSGEVCSTSPDRIEGHYYWFHSPVTIFRRFRHKNATIVGNRVQIQLEGEVTGKEGLKSIVSIVEKALGDKRKVVRAYTLQQSLDGAGVAASLSTENTLALV